ncbi:hypothetical protein CO192_07560, partial [Halopseudomonas pelagia]
NDGGGQGCRGGAGMTLCAEMAGEMFGNDGAECSAMTGRRGNEERGARNSDGGGNAERERN